MHYAPLCFVEDNQQKHFCHSSLLLLQELTQLCQPCPLREASVQTRALTCRYNEDQVYILLSM